MDEPLAYVAAECVRHVMKHPTRGFGNSELAIWCARYRALDEAGRLRVQVLLCKTREVSVVIGAYGAAHFYARAHAPDGAFNIDERRQQHAEAIGRALQWA